MEHTTFVVAWHNYLFFQTSKPMEFTLNGKDGSYKKVEQYDPQITEKLSYHYREILSLLGENNDREGLLQTPERVAKSMQFMLQGYEQDPEEILRSAMFKEDYRQMVIVKDIEIYSMCEHHMLPFIGKAHIGYIPNGYITGLSKIARVVDAYARRLQVQERLTTQIKDCIQNTLNPLGVAVVIEAQHLCMQMRGVQKQSSTTTTSDFTGAFERVATREEFIRLIR
jgi:GTP cyclohydrolase I